MIISFERSHNEKNRSLELRVGVDVGCHSLKERQKYQASKLTTYKVDLSLMMRKAPNLAALVWSLKAAP